MPEIARKNVSRILGGGGLSPVSYAYEKKNKHN